MKKTKHSPLDDKINELALALSEKKGLVFKKDPAEKYYDELISGVKNTNKLFKDLVKTVSELKHLTHEVEWLFDNFYLINKSVKDILENANKKGLKKLPFTGYQNKYVPRIYFILLEFLNLTENDLKRETLFNFIESYQKKAPLSVTELRAIPLFLKIILVEKSSALVSVSTSFFKEYEEAEKWFKIIKKEVKKDKTKYPEITSRLVKNFGIIPVNFGYHLLPLLSAEGKDMKPIVRWLKSNFLKQGIPVEDLSSLESKKRDKHMRLLGNIVNGLRWTNQVRWEKFESSINVVDKVLSKDPSGVFSSCDDKTLGSYREVILQIAERTGIDESEVAKTAVSLSKREFKESVKTDTHSANHADGHVGYYLVDKGRAELEKRTGYKHTVTEKIYRFILDNATPIYFGLVGLFTVFLSAVWGFILALHTPLSNHLIAVVVTVSLLLNVEVVVYLLGAIVAKFLPSKRLPRIDYLKGSAKPPDTVVVIPSMFRDKDSLERIVSRLETHFLGNSNENLYFALLLDFQDDSKEKASKDQAQVEAAEEGIRRLNEKYSPEKQRFFVFYRKRVWNSHEGVFMGWERKRGKLKEFGKLLLGNKETSFITKDDVHKLSKVKYVITLDEDTELPRETALELVGTINHPLNRAVLDKNDEVVRGYGIIQPRIAIRFSTSKKTYFSRLFSYAPGIDSYSNPVSDLYQDLFGSAIFYGKGIYDLNVVEKTIGEKIPENIVLSHDLLEGLYSKTGFAGDIHLFENFLGSYHEYTLRLHRWIRGDWQIISWLKKRSGKKSKANNFGLLDKWRIFDNLRRSSNPIAITLLLLIAWVFSPGNSVYLHVYAIAVISLPLFWPYLISFISWKKNTTVAWRIKARIKDFFRLVFNVLTRAMFTLHHALISADAIARSLFRVYVTRKHALQWKASEDISHKLKDSLWETYRNMWQVQVLSIAGIIISFVGNLSDPFIMFWLGIFFVSPTASLLLSKGGKNNISFVAEDNEFLHLVAGKTYRYFMKFSGKENNWLAVDRFQEEPRVKSVHTKSVTSPTNIGMQLVAFLSAYDLGFMGLRELADKLSNTFESLSAMDRYRGHFYNWYDVKTLKPLPPFYVSSVDSANMLMSLLALKEGLKEILNKPIAVQKNVVGLGNILKLTLLDSNNLVREKNLPKDVRKIVGYIKKEAEAALHILNNGNNISNTDDLEALFTSVLKHERNMNKRIFELRTISGGESVLDIYLSIEHFSKLLEESTKDITGLLPFCLLPHSRPFESNKNNGNDFYAIYQKLYELLDTPPSIKDMASAELKKSVVALDFPEVVSNSKLQDVEKEALIQWYQNLLHSLESAEKKSAEIKEMFENINFMAERFFDEADFNFFYNEERGLFHIGYNAAFEKHDNSFYDFLASESNSISFIAIIKGHVPKKHWFYLDRKAARYDKEPVLLSWGGSLFEYLTSLLFYEVHPNSLLGQAASSAIETHISYGKKNRTPWGIGESAYSVTNENGEYKYQIFGVPGLGLKRGLGEYLVVSPYTSALSLIFKPKKAVKNLKRLYRSGSWGWYGFYDSLDYTGTKEGFGKRKSVPVKIHYAHHQGFILAALNNALNDKRIHKLFHADPRVQTAEFLFEERPIHVLPKQELQTIADYTVKRPAIKDLGMYATRYVPLKTTLPTYAFLSNGRYSVSVSNAGSGLSKWGDINLTRFREDYTLENYGSFFVFHDEETGNKWSPTIQPLKTYGKQNKIIFSENKAEFHRLNNGIKSIMKVAVSQEDDAEVRQITLINQGKQSRKLSVSSFGEVAMTLGELDRSHSLFQRLFVSSKFIKNFNSLMFSRKHVSKEGKKIFFTHILSSSTLGKDVDNVFYGRHRESFYGKRSRAGSPSSGLTQSNESDNLPEYTLDPSFSLQKSFTLKPGGKKDVVFVNTASGSKEEAMRLMEKYSNQRNAVSVVEKASRSHAEELKKIGISYNQALIFQELASIILSSKDKAYVGDTATLSESYTGSLWRHGISGVLPILLVKVKDVEGIPVVKEILLFHRYMKYKGVKIDILILNEYPASYIKVLDDEIDFLIRYSSTESDESQDGKIYHIKSELISNSDKQALLASAKLVVDSKKGGIDNQIKSIRVKSDISKIPKLHPKDEAEVEANISKMRPKNLLYDNGYGGFHSKTGEYIAYVSKDNIPPAPWVNIVANKDFGFIIDESGNTYTWAENSYEGRVTNRIDEQLLDTSSEILYLRDENTGEVWNPTPAPIRDGYGYTVKHGYGYTSFSHTRKGLDHLLTVYTPQEDKVKIFNLKIKNNSKNKKRLSLFSYFDLALGKDDSRQFHNIYKDTEVEAIFAENPFRSNFWDSNYKSRVAIDMNSGDFTYTGDRVEFVGRHGDMTSPKALGKQFLSNNSSPMADNCAALQSVFEINPNEEKEISVIVAEGGTEEALRKLIKKYRDSGVIKEELVKVSKKWDDALGAITVNSPDESLNLLFNKWLLYQSLSSRMLARTGFYQPSGAFGFRDQLQDSLAFLWSNPSVTKDMILRAAARQFEEGDVLNWWHEHTNFGIRTLFSDQHLWLPYVVIEYIKVTNDFSILEEKAHFLKGPSVAFDGAHKWTGIPQVSDEVGTIHEHVIKAIEKGFQFGEHGIPLIGGGDWNDGLDNTGIKGKGESIWLGWFLAKILVDFSKILEKKGDNLRADKCKDISVSIVNSIERHGWDGEWYKRAYHDSGVVLGSVVNKEFKIDSLVQSWSVISGLGKKDRAKTALESAMNMLSPNGELMRLISPPVTDFPVNIGYIKEYPPGVRENASQYNHAAIWFCEALARTGQGDNAYKIFNLINPIQRSADKEKADEYRVEPYAIASDIYSEPNYKNRGGWTWYTGSAGLLYRVILENILGVKIRGNKLFLNPVLPTDWNGCEINYKYGSSVYKIELKQTSSANTINELKLDGKKTEEPHVALIDDGKEHLVEYSFEHRE
ncbi:MAG: glucoamylase family protein [Candidatus Spechtbacterales bacterium]